MKIAILGTAYPYRGGLAAFNERMAYQFLEEGHEVTIYTFTLQYPGFLFPGKTQYADGKAPRGLNIVRCVNSCNPFNWYKVGHRIANEHFDLLVVKYWLPFMAPCFGTIARVAAKKGSLKVVSVLDNIIPHEKRFGDDMFSKYFVRCVDGFVAMSRSVLDDLNLFDEQKPRQFCPHPLYDHYGDTVTKNAARCQIGIQENGKYVLFFGFIRRYKGLDLLLDAFADERIKNLGIKLIVAGEFYGESDSYIQQIDTLGIKDRVVLRTDFIPDGEVYRYFCASDLVVQPYKSATQSGVTQIAFNFDKPMIVTNVGGLPEIVPDGKVGYVVEPEPKQIADAIVRYYEEGKEEAFVEGVRDEKKKYMWDKMTQSIYAVMGGNE